jgi:hypothetical protein
LFGEQDCPLSASLAVAADVPAGAERDVAAVEADELGHAEARLDGEDQ